MSKNPEGLGGWLLLVGLGIVLSPLILVGKSFPIYSQIFSSGSWSVLTTPGSQAYNPMWAPLIIGEIAGNVVLVVGWIFAAILFFSKKKRFPSLYISLLLFGLLFILVDAVAYKGLFPDEPVFDQETAAQFGRALIVSLIWIPYMLISKRVKATFVK